jgi:hypothetical protein
MNTGRKQDTKGRHECKGKQLIMNIISEAYLEFLTDFKVMWDDSDMSVMYNNLVLHM